MSWLMGCVCGRSCRLSGVGVVGGLRVWRCMKLSKAKLDVAMWAVAGVVLAGLIFTGFYLELNVIDSGLDEVVSGGETYYRGANFNGLVGALAGTLGGAAAVVWATVGISWLYGRAK